MSKMPSILLLLALTLFGCGGAGDSSVSTTTTVSEGVETTCDIGQVDGDLYLYGRRDYFSPDLLTSFGETFDVEVVVDWFDGKVRLVDEPAS